MMAISGRARGRQIRQLLPKAPPAYDQDYIAQLADAVNDFMVQATAPAEVTAARFICTDPVYVPSTDVPDTTTLETGTLYLGAPNAATVDSTVAIQAWATGTITLTTAAQTIPGCTATLTRNGTWLLICAYDFVGANEQNNLLYGGVTDSSHLAVCDTGNNNGRFTISNQALVTVSAGQVIQMTAYKTGGSGNSSTGMNSSLSAVWINGAPSGKSYFTIVTPQDLAP
jgi:hypothetical protein